MSDEGRYPPNAVAAVPLLLLAVECTSAVHLHGIHDIVMKEEGRDLQESPERMAQLLKIAPRRINAMEPNGTDIPMMKMVLAIPTRSIQSRKDETVAVGSKVVHLVEVEVPVEHRVVAPGLCHEVAVALVVGDGGSLYQQDVDHLLYHAPAHLRVLKIQRSSSQRHSQ